MPFQTDRLEPAASLSLAEEYAAGQRCSVALAVVAAVHGSSGSFSVSGIISLMVAP